jgi:flagellar biosynthesis protein FliQ
MTSALAADLLHAALWVALQVAAPLLGAMTVTAITMGILQAATQVQDASVSFTPKLTVALCVMWLMATWMASILSGFMHKVLIAIPWMVMR